MTINEIALLKKQFSSFGLTQLASLEVEKYFEILTRLEEPELLDQFLINQGFSVTEFVHTFNAQYGKKVLQLMMQNLNFPASFETPRSQTKFILNQQSYKTVWDGEEIDYLFLGPINEALKKEAIPYRWFFIEPLVLNEQSLISEEPTYDQRLVYFSVNSLTQLEQFLPYSEIEHYCHL